MLIVSQNMLFFGVALVILCFVLLIWEKKNLNKAISRLPHRIHVNGTRGKSSVTEFILAILNHNTHRAAGKITGITPLFFGPDMEARPLHRKGAARVQEQFSIIRRAAKLDCDSLVLECMSIDPELQILENRFLKPEIVVLTNIREDHSESMGNNIREHLNAMTEAIQPPVKCIVTAEKTYLDKIIHRADAIGACVHIPKEYFRQEDLNSHPGVFAENVNLAVSVCEMLGIETEKCVETMKAYLKTRQNNTVTRVKLEFGELEFINAFAVNDIPSLDQFLKPFIKDQIPSFYLVNTRNDRPLRTVHFADWLAGHSGTDRIIIMGDHREKMKRLLIRRKVASHRVLLWNGKNMEELYTLFFREMKKIRLIGVANIAGQALKLCEELIEKGKNAA